MNTIYDATKIINQSDEDAAKNAAFAACLNSGAIFYMSDKWLDQGSTDYEIQPCFSFILVRMMGENRFMRCPLPVFAAMSELLPSQIEELSLDTPISAMSVHQMLRAFSPYNYGGVISMADASDWGSSQAIPISIPLMSSQGYVFSDVRSAANHVARIGGNIQEIRFGDVWGHGSDVESEDEIVWLVPNATTTYLASEDVIEDEELLCSHPLRRAQRNLDLED